MFEKYFTYNEIKVYLIALKTKGVKILGIEKFIFDGENVIPDMSGIADFSDATVEQSHRASLKFLSLYGKDERERFTIDVEEIT